MIKDEFGMFDSVSLKTDLWVPDVFGDEISLRMGKTGAVMEVGEEPGTVIVEFKIGSGMSSTAYTRVEVPAECLEIVYKIGRRFSEPDPELTLAIEAIRAKR